MLHQKEGHGVLKKLQREQNHAAWNEVKKDDAYSNASPGSA
jgi:hypothetical protein